MKSRTLSFDTSLVSGHLVSLAIALDDAQGAMINASRDYQRQLSIYLTGAFQTGGVSLVSELLSEFASDYCDVLIEGGLIATECRDTLRDRLVRPLSRLNGTIGGLWYGVSIKTKPTVSVAVTVATTREGAGIKAPRGKPTAVVAASNAPTVADVMLGVGKLSDQSQLLELVQGIVRDHMTVGTRRELARWVAGRVATDRKRSTSRKAKAA